MEKQMKNEQNFEYHLNRLISYLWTDEQSDYLNTGQNNNHIFVSLHQLREYLEGDGEE